MTLRSRSIRDAARCRWRPPDGCPSRLLQRTAVRAELDAANVADARDLTIGRRADDDVLELIFGRQPALCVDRQLERRIVRRRRCAEHAGRDLQILLADRADHVGGGELTRRQPIGIEPHAHAVFTGAEHLRGADAGDAHELVSHLQVRKFERYSMS